MNKKNQNGINSHNFQHTPLHSPSSGFPSSDIAGMKSSITASLTSAMLSSFTRTSTLEICHA